MTKYPVKQPPITRLFSAAVSLLAVAAWLGASNHCVLASFLPQPVEASSAHSHCGGSQETPPQEEQGGECDGSKCCKSLSAPTLAFAKSVVSYNAGLFTANDYPASDTLSLGTEHDAAILELDTGPPCTHSFAESVLQRSILAHAPPIFA